MEGTTALVFVPLGGCVVAVAGIVVRGMVDVARIRAGTPAGQEAARRAKN